MPNIDLIRGADQGRALPVRTEPAQRRSSERLDALLDATAALVGEFGPERVTTQQVAERAGASIGTVYRYFPDRVAMLDALRERAVRRYRERVADELSRSTPRSWWDVLEIALDACAWMHASEPAFAVVHGADPERAHDDEPEIAHRVARVIEDEFGTVEASSELPFRIGVAVTLGASLIHRAFQRDAAGDQRYLAEAKRVVHDYLEPILGRSADTAHAA